MNNICFNYEQTLQEKMYFFFNLLDNHLLQSQMGIDIRSHQVLYCKFLRLNKGQKDSNLSQFHRKSLYQVCRKYWIRRTLLLLTLCKIGPNCCQLSTPQFQKTKFAFKLFISLHTYIGYFVYPMNNITSLSIMNA